MKLSPTRLRRITEDLALNLPFVSGQGKPIKNCWHFSTDGNAVDSMFDCNDDFMAGMNRIFVVLQYYDVIILAFSLMDTHVHFVLYGTFDECNRFMHDYIKRTSMHIAQSHGDRHKLENVPIHNQKVDNDSYLKTVICYTVRNAPVGGIPFLGGDYPWSSGPLYFRRSGYWSSPRWLGESSPQGTTAREYRSTMKTRAKTPGAEIPMIDGLVFPGEYVAYEIVEQLFRTTKAYLFFMSHSRESDVDSRGGTISRLSIPMQEMRQHRNELCREMFGTPGVRQLDSAQRVRLARALRSRYNSSLKQVARLSGLVYDEIKGVIK